VVLLPRDVLRVLDADGDGVSAAFDCDDGNAQVFPGQTEACNGIDDDCDGQIDEGLFPDLDKDGFGAPVPRGASCLPGWVAMGRDCDDGDPKRFPGAPELCDGQPNACDGAWSPEDEIGTVTWEPLARPARSLTHLFVDTDQPVPFEFGGDGTMTVCGRPDPYPVRWTARTPAYDHLFIAGRAITVGDRTFEPALTGGLGGRALTLMADAEDSIQPQHGDVVVRDLKLTSTTSLEAAIDGVALFASDIQALRLIRVRVENNATNGGAGAVYVRRTDEVEFTDTAFVNNQSGASGLGGALFLEDSELEILTSVFDGNSGGRGGAIYFQAEGNDRRVLRLWDSTLQNNRAKIDGGAIAARGPFATVKLDETIVVGNWAESGGAVVGDGNVQCYRQPSQEGGFFDNAAGAYGGAVLLLGVHPEAQLRNNGCLFGGNRNGASWKDQCADLAFDRGGSRSPSLYCVTAEFARCTVPDLENPECWGVSTEPP
jgi:hypothetical protein